MSTLKRAQLRINVPNKTIPKKRVRCFAPKGMLILEWRFLMKA
ncbi:hypothetical protein LEP1GSC120_3907 [Leptospira santarosai str. 200702252]|nr:hypothetical protein LEP1GSC163_0964 [Leptospira santarosai str. CBC379]EMO97208.1 hypothetical protein LEP1GSC120_3907 [Leptospira santarosai str. 200702252]